MISFIIPAYNAEKTIIKTIDSIKRLHIPKEIIIVENGSSDNTVELLNTISDITVFHSMKGVSQARNVGITKASGEWLVFVDADDECLLEIEKIIPLIDKILPDLFIGSFKKDEDFVLQNYMLNTPISSDDYLLFEEAKAQLISKPTQGMQAWAKVYKKSFILDNSLYFNEDLTYSEDSEFVLRVLEATNKLVFSDIPIYQYNSGTTSAMRGLVEGRVNKYLSALRIAEKDIENSSDLVKHAFLYYLIAHIKIIGVHDIFNVEIKELTVE